MGKTFQEWWKKLRTEREQKGRQVTLKAFCPLCTFSQEEPAGESEMISEVSLKGTVMEHIARVHPEQLVEE